jgi:hypothetical protein
LPSGDRIVITQTGIAVFGQTMEQARELAAFIQGVADDEGVKVQVMPMVVAMEVLRKKAVTALPAVLVEDQVIAMGDRPTSEEIRSWLHLPETVDAAVNLILEIMPGEELEKFLGNAIARYDFGASIRNSLGLWGANKALLRDCGSKTMSADDASSVIIEALKRKLLE